MTVSMTTAANADTEPRLVSGHGSLQNFNDKGMRDLIHGLENGLFGEAITVCDKHHGEVITVINITATAALPPLDPMVKRTSQWLALSCLNSSGSICCAVCP
jgi:hypothetical protein